MANFILIKEEGQTFTGKQMEQTTSLCYPKFTVICLWGSCFGQMLVSKVLKTYQRDYSFDKQNFLFQGLFLPILGIVQLLAKCIRGLDDYVITKAVLAFKEGYPHKPIKEIICPKDKDLYLDTASQIKLVFILLNSSF